MRIETVGELQTKPINQLTSKTLAQLLQQEFGKEGFGNVPLEDCITETEILNKICSKISAAPCPRCNGDRVITSLEAFSGLPDAEPIKEKCPRCEGFGAVILVQTIRS